MKSKTSARKSALQQRKGVSIPKQRQNGFFGNTDQRTFNNLQRRMGYSAATQYMQALMEQGQSSSLPLATQKTNNTGLPGNLKVGIENLSGYSLDDVKVHYNSSKPAQVQADAYAQGTDIHLGPGQEKHLPHEAWHVVQQKQGRVQSTIQMMGSVGVNENTSLEREADLMGRKASKLPAVPSKKIVSGGSNSISGGNNPMQFYRDKALIDANAKHGVLLVLPTQIGNPSSDPIAAPGQYTAHITDGGHHHGDAPQKFAGSTVWVNQAHVTWETWKGVALNVANRPHVYLKEETDGGWVHDDSKNSKRDSKNRNFIDQYQANYDELIPVAKIHANLHLGVGTSYNNQQPYLQTAEEVKAFTNWLVDQDHGTSTLNAQYKNFLTDQVQAIAKRKQDEKDRKAEARKRETANQKHIGGDLYERNFELALSLVEYTAKNEQLREFFELPKKIKKNMEAEKVVELIDTVLGEINPGETERDESLVDLFKKGLKAYLL